MAEFRSASVPALSAADHVRGPADAPLLIEYADFECPFCALLSARLAGRRFRRAYRHFPVRSSHPRAWPAACAAEAASLQGHFWEMHDAIFENQPTLSLPLLAELAQALGLSSEDLPSALESREFLPAIKQDFLGGVRSGVNGTPTFFINGYRYEGLNEFEDLVEAIDAELLSAKTQHRRAG